MLFTNMIFNLFKRTAATTRDERAEFPPEPSDEEFKEKLYQGILWMRDKYEHYRDLADERYERLREQLVHTEKKYEDLLASIAADPKETLLPQSEKIRKEVVADQPEPGDGRRAGMAIVEAMTDQEINARIRVLEDQFAHERRRLEEEVEYLRHQLEEEVARSRRELDEHTAEARRRLELQVEHSNRLLDEKQRIIGGLQVQLRMDREKIEELVTKLRHNSQLLLNIYQELDKSLHFTESSPHSQGKSGPDLGKLQTGESD